MPQRPYDRKMPARLQRWLGSIEQLPDPAMLFVIATGLVWVLSWVLGGYEFVVPAKGGPRVLEGRGPIDVSQEEIYFNHSTILSLSTGLSRQP